MTTTANALNMEQAIEAIYVSLQNDNEDIDIHIGDLKRAMAAAGKKEAAFSPRRLAQNNREGRKMMQAYFRRHGVTVVFES
ncbi:MAG: hypothetical protein HY370_02130 [Proteobacteria bacterium]|nr:hypothetical protein [Pseudomonadota bacterium]